MYVLTIVCAALAVASANPTCTCPADDPDVIQRLNDHDAKINKLIARTQAVKDTINRRKEERADADKDSKNMLLRLNKLDISAEEDKCPKKHFKCVTGGDSFGKRCVANLLVCDGTNDCLDGSDEDPNLCKFPLDVGKTWKGRVLPGYRCISDFSLKNVSLQVEKVVRYETLKSFARVTINFLLGELGQNGEILTTVYPATFIHNYGTRTSWAFILFEELSFKTKNDYYPGEGLILSYDYIINSDEPCSTTVFTDKMQ